ncbi:MAG: tetratricopeptide repeat protein, partial [Saprospiraceae bacterium]
MYTNFRAAWLSLAFACATTLLAAQSSFSEDLQRADKQYDLYAYNLALKTYEEVLQIQPNNAHALARTGDCYFQLNRPEDALPWYDKAVKRQDVEPVALLHYGKALLQTGDYVGAKKWFSRYAETDPTVGNHYVSLCDYALQNAGKESLYAVKNEALNTVAADFSPALYGNRIAYSSSRTDIQRQTQSKTSSDWSGAAYNQLFVTQRNPDGQYLQKPQFLRSDLQNAYNEGPVSFSADGKRVAFCRNNFIDGTRQIAEKGLNMSLYTADVVDGNWMNVKAFPYNGSDFATGFPTLSPNGNML